MLNPLLVIGAAMVLAALALKDDENADLEEVDPDGANRSGDNRVSQRGSDAAKRGVLGDDKSSPNKRGRPRKKPAEKIDNPKQTEIEDAERTNNRNDDGDSNGDVGAD